MQKEIEDFVIAAERIAGVLMPNTENGQMVYLSGYGAIHESLERGVAGSSFYKSSAKNWSVTVFGICNYYNATADFSFKLHKGVEGIVQATEVLNKVLSLVDDSASKIKAESQKKKEARIKELTAELERLKW